MCVADFKPNAGPVERAWVVLHNLDTVVDQARENYALNEGDLDTERQFASVLVRLERGQAEALNAYRTLREQADLPPSIEEEFKKGHDARSSRNKADH